MPEVRLVDARSLDKVYKQGLRIVVSGIAGSDGNGFPKWEADYFISKQKRL